MYSYYLAVALFRSLRTYIPGYDAVITPLTSILDHSNHKMEMRGEAHEAFHLILSHLLTKPWLGHIRPTGQFHLYVDAPLGGARNNRQGIGAALFKESWGIHYPIAFISRSLRPRELTSHEWSCRPSSGQWKNCFHSCDTIKSIFTSTTIHSPTR